MPTYQAYNKKSKAWVKYSRYSGKVKILDVKERNPRIKFKGVPVRGQKKK